MKRAKVMSIGLLLMLGYIPINHYVLGAKEESPPLEEQYKNSGYVTPSKAISQFEKEYGKKIKIPEKVSDYLPFKVIHQFGQFDNSIERPNLLIEYLNEESLASFRIEVFPLGTDLPSFRGEKTAIMKDGTRFIYSKEERFYVFRFETDNWSYILSSNLKGENSKIKNEQFIKVAEFIKKSE